MSLIEHAQAARILGSAITAKASASGKGISMDSRHTLTLLGNAFLDAAAHMEEQAAKVTVRSKSYFGGVLSANDGDKI